MAAEVAGDTSTTTTQHYTRPHDGMRREGIERGRFGFVGHDKGQATSDKLYTTLSDTPLAKLLQPIYTGLMGIVQQPMIPTVPLRWSTHGGDGSQPDPFQVSGSSMRVNHHPDRKSAILIIDDEVEVHGDYKRTLSSSETTKASGRRRLEQDLFGFQNPPSVADPPSAARYQLFHAYQGEEAVEIVRSSMAKGLRFSLAFVDMRMPPGFDGVDTIRRMWELDSGINCVICTAYSDFTWKQTTDRLGSSEGLYLLRKPFQPHQIRKYAEMLIAARGDRKGS